MPHSGHLALSVEAAMLRTRLDGPTCGGSVGPITKVIVGGYLALIALAVVATVTTEGDGDGLEYLALEAVALPWTVVLVVAGTPDSVYPWLLTAGAVLNATLLFLAGRALGQRRARKAGHSTLGA